MNELIPVNYGTEQVTISARDLHEFLEIKSNFRDWFPRMTEYGLEEGIDFNPLKNERVRFEGGREVSRELQDYQLTIDAAKQIAMIQRNEKGKMARQYFIQIEKAWNDPEQVLARALKLADNKIDELKKIQVENQPKIDHYDKYMSSKTAVDMTSAAKELNIKGIGRNKLFQILRDQKVLMRDNKPYQQYIDNRYFRVIVQTYQKVPGEYHTSTKTLVLPKGFKFIEKVIERYKKRQ